MKLTVLGKYGPYPKAGGACSGYLLQEGNTKILIDCGNGVLSRLQQICDVRELSCIILSHLHSDHVSDMMVLRYALEIWKARGLCGGDPIPVYLPPNPKAEYDRVVSSHMFKPYVIQGQMELYIDGIQIRFKEMTHPYQSFGTSFSKDGRRLVYTGDTSYNDGILEFASQAELLIADAGLLKRDLVQGKSPHMSADEVGRVAKTAGVKKLMLSHVWPGYEESELIAEAAAHFSDPIIAEEMKTYII